MSYLEKKYGKLIKEKLMERNETQSTAHGNFVNWYNTHIAIVKLEKKYAVVKFMQHQTNANYNENSDEDVFNSFEEAEDFFESEIEAWKNEGFSVIRKKGE